MRILIDTHILIWHLEGDSQLSRERKQLIISPDNDILISIASLWEIAIKLSKGKLKLSKPIDAIISQIETSSSRLLAVNPEQLVLVSSLPFYHKDPFDRLLISQSLVEGIPIISSDPNFAEYGVKLL